MLAGDFLLEAGRFSRFSIEDSFKTERVMPLEKLSGDNTKSFHKYKPLSITLAAAFNTTVVVKI